MFFWVIAVLGVLVVLAIVWGLYLLVRHCYWDREVPQGYPAPFCPNFGGFTFHALR
jgi:hypothetical protein